FLFFFSSRRRHTRSKRDWSSDVCSSDLGVINVVSKSGTNDWHGGLSFFHRNYKLDSSDSSKVLNGEVPFLLRWDPSAQFGGPLRSEERRVGKECTLWL